jgi:glycerate kinase
MGCQEVLNYLIISFKLVFKLRIVICPDSYKESLSSNELVDVMEKACIIAGEGHKNLKIFKLPMADGGEGTVQALVQSTNGRIINTEVYGPEYKKIQTIYGANKDNSIAFIEAAKLCGIELVPFKNRNPYLTTSYGVGEMIVKLLDKGYQRIVLGLGGSITNDGGIGMLTALGAEFFDHHHRKLDVFGQDMLKVEFANFSGLDQRLEKINIQIASDVENVLCGEEGASKVFGPQKNATPEQVEVLDRGLDHFSNVIEKELGVSYKYKEGAGAAGGLGFSSMILGAEMRRGAEMISSITQLETKIQRSDLVITGEGKSDRQTLLGKLPGHVANIANKYNKPVILISGSIEDTELLNDRFTGVFSVINGPMTLIEAMYNVRSLVYSQTLNIMNFYRRLTE